MNTEHFGSQPDGADESVTKPDNLGDTSALREYVTRPTAPRLRAMSGRYAVTAPDSLQPTKPPEDGLVSEARVHLETIDTTFGAPPESLAPDTQNERDAPLTDRCGAL